MNEIALDRIGPLWEAEFRPPFYIPGREFVRRYGFTRDQAIRRARRYEANEIAWHNRRKNRETVNM